MKHRPAAFPIVIGVITTSTEPLSEPVLNAVGDVFQNLPESKDSTPWVIYAGARTVGKQIADVAGRTGLRYQPSLAENEDSHGTGLTAAAMEFIEGCDAVILVSEKPTGAALAEYVLELDRSLIQVDPTAPRPLVPAPRAQLRDC